METRPLRWSELTIGITIVIAFAIFLIGIILVGSNVKLFTATYTVRMFVPNIEGLVEGSMVTLAGRKVGYVKDMQFGTRDDVSGVEVSLSIDSKFQTQITDKSIATIKTIGLLGDKYVDISLGQSGERVMEEGNYVQVDLSPDLAAIARKVSTSVDDFVQTVRHARNIVQRIDEGKGTVGRLVTSEEMSESLDRFASSASRIAKMMESKNSSAGRLLRDSTLYVNLSTLVQNLGDITAKIKSGEGTLGKIATDASLYEEISRFATQSDSLLLKVNTPGGTADRLLTDPQFYENVVQLVKVLNDLVGDFKEHPDRYFHFSVF